MKLRKFAVIDGRISFSQNSQVIRVASLLGEKDSESPL